MIYEWEPDGFVRFDDLTRAVDDLRPPRTVAKVVPVAGDFARNQLTIRMEDLWDPIRRPWRYPDRNPMPKLAWWPWIDTLRAAPAEARTRMQAAAEILRHGAHDRDEDRS